ncbi:MAG TPA: tetratricopeptide repeat protein [Rhodocyclaceae bacterium]|nr:tetratricopeptide repeat protein [Rhodocyclaceae bacterium]
MTLIRTVLLAFLLAIGLPAWCEEGPPAGNAQDTSGTQLMNDGYRLLMTGKPKEAIKLFEQVAASYEDRFKDDNAKFFSARTQPETLMYLMEAAASKNSAKVVSQNWAYAYYLKAYALVELGNFTDAKPSLERALALSPRNAQFLAELGNIYQREKDWKSALETFELAEAAAKEFSPPNMKNVELSRAWRGQGFVHIEQNRLDDAEKLYLRCLELDKNDAKALNELRYIEKLRQKQSTQ